MLTIFWLFFWAALAALVVAAGISVHTRRKELLASSVPTVDDDAVERILRTGELRAAEGRSTDLPLIIEDEPLDQREIDDEEERFWSESWDEPTEW